MLPTSHAAFWKNFIWCYWRPNLWVLRKIWLAECLPYENHFFLFINQKVGYPAIYTYTVYFPKILLSQKSTENCSLKNVLYLQDILLTCNIWKDLFWNHFQNLVGSFRRVQQQNIFVMLSRFWLLRGCEGGGLSEYIKIFDENEAVAI